MSCRPSPDRRARLAPGLLGIVALSVVACASPAPETPPELEFDGCLYVLEPVEQPTCVLDEAQPSLRLWVRSGGGAEIEVTAGKGSWLASAAEPVQDGYLFRLEDVDAAEIVVRAAAGRRTLRLARDVRSPYKSQDWSYEELAERLRAGVPDEELGFLLGALGFAEQGSERSRLLEASAAAHGRQGRRSEQINRLTAVHFYLYSELDRPGEAARILARIPEVPRGDGRSAFYTAFYRGSWAARVGLFANALLELEAASRQAERLALKQGLLAEQDLAHVLVRLGRHEQAGKVLSRLRRRAGSGEIAGCELADLFNDVGWSELLMLEAGLDVDPAAALEAARRGYRSCEDRAEQRIWEVEINLALTKLAQGLPGESRQYLRRAASLDPQIWWSRSWQQETEARLALAEAKYVEAGKLFEALSKAPEAKFNAGLQWRAAIGTARSLEGRGRTPEALAAYEEAENLAFAASFSMPFDESRFSGLYQRETLYYLELLVKLGRHDAARRREAVRVARRSLARNLRRLALGSRLQELEPVRQDRWNVLVRQYWSLTSRGHRLIRQEEAAAADRAREIRREREQLEQEATQVFEQALGLLDAGTLGADAEPRRPRPGELLLVYHPLGRGWVGFAYDDHGVVVARIDGDEEDPAKLLVPFAEPLHRAARITVLPYGKLWQVSFHALPFDGSPLLRHAEVVYSLDLPELELPGPASRRALLAMDSQGDLVHAGTEVARVEDLLRRDEPPWEVAIETDVEALRRGLETAPGIFHFAGHSQILSWEAVSGLVLERRFGEDVRMTIRDILALTAVPELVVLSACESTLPVLPEEPSSLGVGQAFLLAGSRRVVGASEKIDDRATGAAIERFYRELRISGSPAAALRAVQVAPGAPEEWMKLRVVDR